LAVGSDAALHDGWWILDEPAAGNSMSMSASKAMRAGTVRLSLE
jgi:hypothetical protein